MWLASWGHCKLALMEQALVGHTQVVSEKLCIVVALVADKRV